MNCKFKIEKQTDWKHDFDQIGKMFGILIVQKNNGEIGYLSAFSGKLADCSILKGFVSPVFDMLEENSFFLEGEKEINSLNENLKTLESRPKFIKAHQELELANLQSTREIRAQKEKIKIGKEERKLIRDQARIDLEEEDARAVREELNQESIREKIQLRNLSNFLKEEIAKKQANVDQYNGEVERLKELRKNKSID